MCNVHSHGTKHCPWCAIGLAGSVAVWAAIVGVQILIATRPTPMHVWTRTALSIGAFPVVGGVLALALGLATGYWS